MPTIMHNIHAMLQFYTLLLLQVPLGVITKSEQKMEDIIEILENLQKYFPKNSNGEPVVTFLAGDQITCERV